MFCYPSLSPKCRSDSWAALRLSWMVRIKNLMGWLPKQMSLPDPLANCHRGTGMLQNPATLGLSSENTQAIMHFLLHSSLLAKPSYRPLPKHAGHQALALFGAGLSPANYSSSCFYFYTWEALNKYLLKEQITPCLFLYHLRYLLPRNVFQVPKHPSTSLK